ncbi:MAG: cell wall hydrolase [Lachnospiraceae bacterium]|nr:cell wall hydrolase [Lachnospiraceae bacterium]
MAENDRKTEQTRTEKSKGRKRAVIFLLVFLIVGVWSKVSVLTVYSTEATRKELEEAKEAKEETEADLNQTQEELENLAQEKEKLQGELNNLNSQLQSVSDRLSELEDQIEQKESEIETAQRELEEARAVEEWQYQCMKKRIQFIYETKEYVILELLFSSANFSDFLNKNDYIEQISRYDKKKLEEYQQVKNQVIEKEAQLAQEKEELDGYKAQAEVEKGSVSTLVNQTIVNLAGKSDQMAIVEQEAFAYEQQIREQKENIARLQEKLEEEIALSRRAAQSTWRDISEVQFAEGDRYLLANLIFCEAGGEDYAGQVGVGAVVMNRVLSSVFPDSVVGVIYQSGQFSPVASGRLAAALAENKATESCYRAADAAMNGETNVGNCVFFRTPIPGLTGISIGGHIFY